MSSAISEQGIVREGTWEAQVLDAMQARDARKHDWWTAKQIASDTWLGTSSVYQALRRLEVKGYVKSMNYNSRVLWKRKVVTS